MKARGARLGVGEGRGAHVLLGTGAIGSGLPLSAISTWAVTQTGVCPLVVE